MKSTLLKATFYLTLSSVIFMTSGYIINIWLGRHLGPSEYGVYGIIISIVTVINLTQIAGLPQAVAKYISSDIDNSEAIYRTGFLLQLISTCLVSLIFFLFSQSIANLLKDSNLTLYLQLAAFIFPIYGLFALLTGYYNGMHLFGRQAFIHIVYSVVKVITIFILAIYFHLLGVIIGFIISPIIAMLSGFHMPRSDSTYFPFKKLLLFSLPLICVAIFSNLLQSIDLFFVKAIMHSDKYAGFYTANQNIAEIPFYALTALSSILLPSISRSVSQNLHEQTRSLISKSLRFGILILTPGVILISATSFKILAFLFSSEYSPGATSLSILVIGSGFFTLFTLLSTIISSAGFPHKSAILAGIGVLITSFLCMLLIPHFGLNGAALATTIAGGFMMIASAVIVYRKFNVLFSIKSVIKIFLSSIVIFFLAKIINVPTFFLPMLYIALFIIYLYLLSAMREITHNDIELVKSLLPSKIIKFLNMNMSNRR